MDVNTAAKYILVVLGYAALGAMVYLGKFDGATYANMIVAGVSVLAGYHAAPINGAK